MRDNARTIGCQRSVDKEAMMHLIKLLPQRIVSMRIVDIRVQAATGLSEDPLRTQHPGVSVGVGHGENFVHASYIDWPTRSECVREELGPHVICQSIDNNKRTCPLRMQAHSMQGNQIHKPFVDVSFEPV